MTLKRGLVTRTAMDESVAEKLQATLPLLASEVWPGAPGDEMFQNLASLYESVHNDRLSVELCAAVFFYATVYDAFARCTGAMARIFDRRIGSLKWQTAWRRSGDCLPSAPRQLLKNSTVCVKL
jgi:hypothetical protein